MNKFSLTEKRLSRNDPFFKIDDEDLYLDIPVLIDDEIFYFLKSIVDDDVRYYIAMPSDFYFKDVADIDGMGKTFKKNISDVCFNETNFDIIYIIKSVEIEDILNILNNNRNDKIYDIIAKNKTACDCILYATSKKEWHDYKCGIIKKGAFLVSRIVKETNRYKYGLEDVNITKLVQEYKNELETILLENILKNQEGNENAEKEISNNKIEKGSLFGSVIS